MVAEVSGLAVSVLKAEKVLFFLYNKDIDHLYTVTAKSSQLGQFGIDSIRMRANLGLSGQSFTEGRIMIERDAATAQTLCAEEKDLKKLGLTELRNAIAIPIFDKQSGASIAVCQAYNFDEANYLSAIDETVLMSLSNIFSACIFNMDNLHGLMVTNDMLSTQFTLSNEAVIFVNTQQMITKVNKTAELLFNRPAETSVGLQLAEFFGTSNN